MFCLPSIPLSSILMSKFEFVHVKFSDGLQQIETNGANSVTVEGLTEVLLMNIYFVLPNR